MTLIAAHPDEIAAELERRRTLRQREENALRYRFDPILWINENVWIASKFNEAGGRIGVRTSKMVLWPDQETTIREWIDLDHLRDYGELRFRNLLVEKSRQIGETWVFAAIICWLLHFHETRGLFMHQRLAEVADRGWTIDSFFGRVKYVDDHLDKAARPNETKLVFRPPASDPAAIENPRTKASVRGECQRDDPGRGSTFDWAIVDEAAHVTHGELVHAAIDDACAEGKVYLSTPWGDDNFHARLCDERPEGWQYLRLHWSTHPIYGQGTHVAGQDEGCEKCRAIVSGEPWSPSNPVAHRYPGRLTSPWYDRAVIGKTDEQVAGELDIDRAGALGARVYGEFESSIHVVRDGIPYDDRLPLELALDFGLDCTSIPVIQQHPSEVRVIGLFEAGDYFDTVATPEEVSNGLRAYLEGLGVDPALIRKPASFGIRAIGDPAGGSRSTQTGKSDVFAYRTHGFTIGAPSRTLTASVTPSIQSVKGLLLGKPKMLRVCGANAREFANHMRNNVWPMDAAGQRRIGSTTPHDNVHNHCCRAFAYWAVATYPPAGARVQSILTIAEGQA